jgi:hypothetical protein
VPMVCMQVAPSLGDWIDSVFPVFLALPGIFLAKARIQSADV